MKSALILTAAILLSGCIVIPTSVARYDSKCDLEYRSLTLRVRQVNLLDTDSCSDNCGPLLAAYVLIPPVSAVVSGSIVLAGNTLSWMERRRECFDGVQ